MKMMKRFTLVVLVALICLLVASAGHAEDVSVPYSVCVSDNHYAADRMADGAYTTWWESTNRREPWVVIRSEEPIYGLYLCFVSKPDVYEIQERQGENWMTVIEDCGSPFYHVFYEMSGQKEIRILSADCEKKVLGFNEICAFGKGEIPDWVQRWKTATEKTELLFLVAHPDDEVLFFGGAIPTYAAEKGKNVEVAYITCCNAVRRSEALNALWAMGVRQYPEFGPFADRYPESGELADGYIYAGGKQAVLEWVTGLFRKYRPDVVVTHAETGEYGHPQHKVAADASKLCFALAADASNDPDSAWQYGTWQVKKLYLHLYGNKEDQTALDWDRPLVSFGGKTGAQVASDAFALHVSQKGAGIRWKEGEYAEFKVETFGAQYYPYDHFGLVSSTVGEDREKNDYLENVPKKIENQ